MPRNAVPAYDPDSADVDFVVGSVDPGTDEELAQPSGRRRILLPLVVGVVVAALVVVALVGRHPEPQPAAAPTASPAAPTTTAPALLKPRLDISDIRLNPITGEVIDIRNGRVIAQAPTRLGSTTNTERPAAVLVALRARFPDVRAVRVESDISQAGGRLLERQITARSGGLDLLIHIEPASPKAIDRIQQIYRASANAMLIHAVRSGSLISVRVSSTRGARFDFAVVSKLANDRRLLALG